MAILFSDDAFWRLRASTMQFAFLVPPLSFRACSGHTPSRFGPVLPLPPLAPSRRRSPSPTLVVSLVRCES